MRGAGHAPSSSARSPTRWRGVEWGERVSYGELAARAGPPGAPRAAGAFCSSRCPLELLLPAHRVVRADGSLGEYGSHGIAYKQRLLALEGSA